MQRRDVIKTAGGIVFTSAVGGAALVAGTGGATASAGGSISDPQPATSDDGRIKWVATQTTGRVTWDGLDNPVNYFRILVDVELHQDGSQVWSGQIHDTGKTDAVDAANNGWGNAGDEVVLSGDYGEGRAGYIASDADWGLSSGIGTTSTTVGTACRIIRLRSRTCTQTRTAALDRRESSSGRRTCSTVRMGTN